MILNDGVERWRSSDDTWGRLEEAFQLEISPIRAHLQGSPDARPKAVPASTSTEGRKWPCRREARDGDGISTWRWEPSCFLVIETSQLRKEVNEATTGSLD